MSREESALRRVSGRSRIPRAPARQSHKVIAAIHPGFGSNGVISKSRTNIDLRLMGDSAELVVVDQLVNCWIHPQMGHSVLSQLQLAKLHLERIEQYQTPPISESPLPE
jgi:hypothetical protein